MEKNADERTKPDFSLLRLWIDRVRSNRYWLKLYALPMIYVLIWLAYYVYGLLAWYAPPVGDSLFPGMSHGWFGYYIIDTLRTAAMINLVAIPALVAFPELRSFQKELAGKPPLDLKNRLLNLYYLALLYAVLPVASIIAVKGALIGMFSVATEMISVVNLVAGVLQVSLTYGVAALAVTALAFLGVLILDITAGAIAGATVPYALYQIFRFLDGWLEELWNRTLNRGWLLLEEPANSAWVLFKWASLFGVSTPSFSINKFLDLLTVLIFFAVVWGLFAWILAGHPRLSPAGAKSMMARAGSIALDWLRRHFSSSE